MSAVKLLGPVIVLMLLACLGVSSPFTISSVRKVYGATHSISLAGDRTNGWNGTIPGPTITVVQFDTVNLQLTSADGAPHRFFIDINNNQIADCPSPDTCSFNTPTTLTFTVNFGHGPYTYYCSFHPNMIGSFVVQQPAPDFSITLNPSSLTVSPGSSGTVSITLTSQNGFTGNVNLTGTVSPSGPSLTFSPTTVPLSSGSSGTSTLTIATSSGLYSNVPVGSYTVTATGTGSPNVVRSVSLSLSVTSSASPGSGLPTYVLIIAGVAIVSVVLVLAYAILKRKPRT